MILFIGIAGSGKSLQGKLLAKALGCPWISGGQLLRERSSGERLEQINAGKLLDDQEILDLVDEVIEQHKDREFIYDGFPRTLRQTDWLVGKFEAKQVDLTAVFHLLADKEVVKERLLKRGRADDHESAINDRFSEYDKAIEPILGRFKRARVPIHEIDGEQTSEQVHQSIMKALNQ